jgi:hypothetical protein
MSGRAKYYSDRPPRREPTPITELLGLVVEQAGVTFGTGLARLKEGWEAIAGEAWADTRPMMIRDGLLVVEVPNGARASLLRFESDTLRERIHERFGPGFVTGIRLRVARPGNGR